MDSFVHSLYVIILFQNLVQTLYTSLNISYHVDERCVIIILVVRDLLDVKDSQVLCTYAGLILNTTDVSGVSYFGSHGARKSVENR